MSSNCTHPNCFDLEVCRRPPKTPKARQPIRRTGIKKHPSKPKESQVELKTWFLDRAKEMIGRCCNCGGDSCAYSSMYWKWSICHIFPKEPQYGFSSVSTHPLNWIELCIPCHTLFDRSLSVAHTMKCWKAATDKFLLFEKDIKENNRKYLAIFKSFIS